MTTTATIAERIKQAGSTGKTSRELRDELGIPAGTATSRTATLLKQGKLKRAGRRDGAFVLVWDGETPKVVDKIHYEILIDSTGSMDYPIPNNQGVRVRKCESVVKLVEAQLAALDRPPSLWSFSEKYTLDQAKRNPNGFGTNLLCTQLFEKTAQALRRAMEQQGPKVVLVFTDGIADDRPGTTDFREAFEEATKQGDVTLAFMVPGEGKSLLLGWGIPEGNIRVWGTVEEASKAAVKAHKLFDREVKTSGGKVRSTKNYFKADLSRVTAADLSELTDISTLARIWTVQIEEDMEDFLAAKQKRTGNIYVPGTGFYEVMKREKNIPQDRKLLIYVPQTGRILTDGKRSVRALCGYPEKGDIAVEPGNHAGFVVLAQSKSSKATTIRARILPRGTRVILWSGAVS